MIHTSRFVIVFLLLGAAALYMHFHHDKPVPMNKSFAEFPRHVADWRSTRESAMTADTLQVLKPTDYLSRQYVDGSGNTISLYIGYHDGGKDTGEIHSPKHCLPGSGWQAVSADRTELVVGTERLKLASAVYQKGGEQELFLYWFRVHGATLAEEFSLKRAQIINSLLHGRRDSTFIRISVPASQDLQKARATGERFIRDFQPVIEQFLPA